MLLLLTINPKIYEQSFKDTYINFWSRLYLCTFHLHIFKISWRSA